MAAAPTETWSPAERAGRARRAIPEADRPRVRRTGAFQRA
jgi:hypothetical protein